MAKSPKIRRLPIFVALFGALLVYLATGAASVSCAAEPAGNSRANLEQAAQSVADAAKETVHATKNDQEAVRRALLSLDIIRAIGELGGFDSGPQADKLMDDFRADGRPFVVETIVQVQFSNKLRSWTQMSEAERTAALDRLVKDVKKTGLTRGYADLFLQLANVRADFDQSKMVSQAITDVLPTLKDNHDPKMKQIGQKLEGIARLLNLTGKPIELEGKLLDGSKFDWSSYKGKVVLIDFSASWCGPCRAEAPNVLKNYHAYHDKGFEVVSVSLDSDPHLAERCIQETGCDFPTLFSDDPNTRGWEHPMVTKYGVMAIPRMILVGRDGNVISIAASGESLNRMLEKLLGQPGEGDDTGNATKSSSTSQRYILGRRLDR